MLRIRARDAIHETAPRHVGLPLIGNQPYKLAEVYHRHRKCALYVMPCFRRDPVHRRLEPTGAIKVSLLTVVDGGVVTIAQRRIQNAVLHTRQVEKAVQTFIKNAGYWIAARIAFKD
jgi:hypothetical protein